MGRVTVSPDHFEMVDFDADRVRSVAETLLDRLGFADDADLRVEIDETSPLGRVRVESRAPLVIAAEGGAFEDPKRPRHLSEVSVAGALGRLLAREKDRQDTGFGAPDPEAELSLAEKSAWDARVMGRLSRLGYRSQRQRWLYHFRNRCGFTDAADAAFAEIWEGDELSWGEITGLVEGAIAVRDAATA
jgi:hypothetical protein